MLQQSPSLSPLMQQFSSFTQIATPTSYHNVRGIIGTATRKRHYMVNVAFAIAIAQFYMAIVALTLLGFVHSLDIQQRVSAAITIFVSTSAIVFDGTNSRMLLQIPFIVNAFAFSTHRYQSKSLHSMCVKVFKCCWFSLLTMSAYFHTIDLAYICLIVFHSGVSIETWPANRPQSAVNDSAFVEVFRGCRKNLFTGRTLLHSSLGKGYKSTFVSHDCSIRFSTWLASAMKYAFSNICCIEVFSGSRLDFIATKAQLISFWNGFFLRMSVPVVFMRISSDANSAMIALYAFDRGKVFVSCRINLLTLQAALATFWNRQARKNVLIRRVGTVLTRTTKAVCAMPIMLKVLLSSRVKLLASGALLLRPWYYLVDFLQLTVFHALPALRTYTIDAFCTRSKVLRSCRKFLQADSTPLGMRGVIHDLNCLSFSALFSCCQDARLHLFKRGNYSLSRQRSNNTFFHTACKAEIGGIIS